MFKSEFIHVRMRIRFSNSCVSDKLDRSVSRFMRHPIEKTDGEFQAMTSTTGCFPDKACVCGGGGRGAITQYPAITT